jgi:hypothetical protein
MLGHVPPRNGYQLPRPRGLEDQHQFSSADLRNRYSCLFTPARQWLLWALESSPAQVAVLKGGYSLARHFRVPFASDSES